MIISNFLQLSVCPAVAKLEVWTQLLWQWVFGSDGYSTPRGVEFRLSQELLCLSRGQLDELEKVKSLDFPGVSPSRSCGQSSDGEEGSLHNVALTFSQDSRRV